MIKNYDSNNMLKRMLGKRRYKDLKKYTKKRLKEEFIGLYWLKTKKLIYLNHTTLLIIIGVKARRLYDEKIERFINLNDIAREKCLINPDLKEFEKEYIEYINEALDYLEKNRKSKYGFCNIV